MDSFDIASLIFFPGLRNRLREEEGNLINGDFQEQNFSLFLFSRNGELR